MKVELVIKGEAVCRNRQKIVGFEYKIPCRLTEIDRIRRRLFDNNFFQTGAVLSHSVDVKEVAVV